MVGRSHRRILAVDCQFHRAFRLRCGVSALDQSAARPIIIHPDGDLTINYLDTKGLPLTPDHLSAATALVARMIGTSAQEDKQMLRQAQIAKYLNLLYEDAFQDWQNKRHDQLLDIAIALAVVHVLISLTVAHQSDSQLQRPLWHAHQTTRRPELAQ